MSLGAGRGKIGRTGCYFPAEGLAAFSLMFIAIIGILLGFILTLHSCLRLSLSGITMRFDSVLTA